jgi:hypothetical protein
MENPNHDRQDTYEGTKKAEPAQSFRGSPAIFLKDPELSALPLQEVWLFMNNLH